MAEHFSIRFARLVFILCVVLASASTIFCVIIGNFECAWASAMWLAIAVTVNEFFCAFRF